MVAAKRAAAKTQAPKAQAPKAAAAEPPPPTTPPAEPPPTASAPKPSASKPGLGRRGGGGGGGTGIVGGLLSLAPGIALSWAQSSAQERMDEAAKQRASYTGMPTKEQIELQESCGYHFTGNLDADGRPIWQYKPSGWQNFRWNFMGVMDPSGEGPQPGGSQSCGDWCA